MKQLLLLLTLLWVWWAYPVSADIYRWTDANGVMHFSNEPPPAGAKVLNKVEETAHDADADRQRIEAERRYRLEREKVELEGRKSELASRERAAQLNLEEANRRMQQAQQQQQQAQQQKEQARGCGVPYRLGTDGKYYPDPPPVGVIVYGDVVYFNDNCPQVLVIEEYHFHGRGSWPRRY